MSRPRVRFHLRARHALAFEDENSAGLLSAAGARSEAVTPVMPDAQQPRGKMPRSRQAGESRVVYDAAHSIPPHLFCCCHSHTVIARPCHTEEAACHHIFHCLFLPPLLFLRCRPASLAPTPDISRLPPLMRYLLVSIA